MYLPSPSERTSGPLQVRSAQPNVRPRVRARGAEELPANGAWLTQRGSCGTPSTANAARGMHGAARRGTARATVRVQLLEPALARRSAHPAHDELERVDQLACSGARWARRKPRRRWPLRRCSARLGCGCGCGICAAGGCRPAWQRIAQAGRAGAMVRLENHIPRRHFASAVTHRLRRCRALNPQKASGSARGRPTCAPLLSIQNAASTRHAAYGAHQLLSAHRWMAY